MAVLASTVSPIMRASNLGKQTRPVLRLTSGGHCIDRFLIAAIAMKRHVPGDNGHGHTGAGRAIAIGLAACH